MFLGGDNNVYEASGNGRKRSRSWCNDRFMSPDFMATEQEILTNIDNHRKSLIESGEKSVVEYNDESYRYEDKRFGYHTACSIYGKSTRGTTFTAWKNLFVNGMKEALSIEELKEKGVRVYIYAYYYSKDDWQKTKGDLEIKQDVYFESTQHLIDTLAEWKEYYKGKASFYIKYGSEWSLENLKRERTKRREKPQPKYADTNKFYIIALANGEGYFLRYTRTGYKYTFFRSNKNKKFLTEEAANKYHKKMRSSEHFEVKLIETPYPETIRVSG
jgi:hypothetical protein